MMANTDKWKNKRVNYTVMDTKKCYEEEEQDMHENILPMSLTNAIRINALLEKSLNLIKIQRLETDRDTRYTFAPI